MTVPVRSADTQQQQDQQTQMNEIQSTQEEISAKFPGGEFKARGSDILVSVFGALVLAGLASLGTAFWIHHLDTQSQSRATLEALTAFAGQMKLQVEASRESNCLNRLPPESPSRQQCYAITRDR